MEDRATIILIEMPIIRNELLLAFNRFGNDSCVFLYCATQHFDTWRRHIEACEVLYTGIRHVSLTRILSLDLYRILYFIPFLGVRVSLFLAGIFTILSFVVVFLYREGEGGVDSIPDTHLARHEYPYGI